MAARLLKSLLTHIVAVVTDEYRISDTIHICQRIDKIRVVTFQTDLGIQFNGAFLYCLAFYDETGDLRFQVFFRPAFAVLICAV